MNSNDLLTLSQRLREYNHNPHHINPVSDAFHKLITESAEALSQFAAIQGGMGEEVEVVAWLGGNGYHATESECTGAPFALMTVAQHQRITEALRGEVERLKDALETESMRLAACGVAALGYFDGCAEAYESASLRDVLALRAQLSQQQGVPEGWRDAYGRLVEFIKNADVSSGVCCCGGRADHQYDDHSPVDMWDHCVLEIVKEYEAMLAATPAPVAEPASPWVAVSERLPLKWQTVLVAYESDADGEPCLDVGSAALGADGKFYGMGHFYVLGTATLEPRICVKPVTHWMPLTAAPEVKP